MFYIAISSPFPDIFRNFDSFMRSQQMAWANEHAVCATGYSGNQNDANRSVIARSQPVIDHAFEAVMKLIVPAEEIDAVNWIEYTPTSDASQDR